MTERPLVMMYSPDSIGLGHVRRNSAIATAFIRHNPEAAVVLLVGSGAGAFFALPKGVDSIKLPSVQKVAAEDWVPRSLNLPVPETYELRSNLIREAVETLRPNILLVDHLPLGVWNELLPTFRAIRDFGLQTRVVLGLRDILDEPAIIRRRWAQHGTYDAISAYYDAILIYGDETVVPTADIYGLSERFPEKIRYCGYVSSAVDKTAREPREEDLPGVGPRREDQSLILACAGGGHDGMPMISAALDALALLKDDDRFKAVVVPGPLMADHMRSELADQARRNPNVSFLPFTTDGRSYFKAADVSIIMGGYNSSLEAVTDCSKVIMIPRDGPSAEQSMRSELFSKRGLLTEVRLSEATPEHLAEVIKTVATSGNDIRPEIKLDGADRAVKELSDLIAAKDVPTIGRRPQASKEAKQYVIF